MPSPPSNAEARTGWLVTAAVGTAAITVAILVLVFLRPGASALLAPAAVVFAMMAAGAAMLLVAGGRDRQRAALAAENNELRQALEEAADRAWELQESEMRYRSLDAARERAEAASQAKNRFLATISHELRTPLNGILGLNDLLLESGLTAAQETYARGVRSSGTALLALVEDLLDFSKIEAGRLDLRPEPASLERLIEEVAEILAPRAHQKGIDFAVDLDPAIPARLLVDTARLRQVVINLAGNAVKFTEAGGVTISAAVEGRTPGLRISLAVADSGPGIPPGDAERLFREFEQADAALTRRHGGAGLGLAISRRIVAAMGGSLSVAPRPGGGSIFRFALHLGGIAGERPALPSLARRRLLVVMPEGFEATVVARDLVRGGAEARRVGTVNAAAALAGAAEAAGLPYHAVLLDRRCVADPRVAMARLREAAGGRMACVLLVSPADRGEIARFREAGLDGYLVRPVWRRSLVGGTAAAIEGVGDFHPDPRDRERQAPPPVRAGASGLQILLAEDDEISALLARAVIESEGHAVTDVRDGHSAVAAAVEGEGRFDLAFLDLHMPGIDGLSAAVRIRDHERTTGRRRLPLVALTADTLPETRRAALAAGIDSVVEKPASPAVLRAAIADFAPGFGSA